MFSQFPFVYQFVQVLQGTVFGAAGQFTVVATCDVMMRVQVVCQAAEPFFKGRESRLGLRHTFEMHRFQFLFQVFTATEVDTAEVDRFASDLALVHDRTGGKRETEKADSF